MLIANRSLILVYFISLIRTPNFITVISSSPKKPSITTNPVLSIYHGFQYYCLCRNRSQSMDTK